MTRVHVSVEDRLLDDVSVDVGDQTYSWSEDRQRSEIRRLLNEAAFKIRGAYNVVEGGE